MIATRLRIAALAVAALTPVLVAAAPPQAADSRVKAADLSNCNANGGVAPCFEPIWSSGVQLKMTFVDLNPKPSNAPTRNFYVTAPQTGTPQGLVPFLHDHVIGAVRPQKHGDDGRVLYHGFFVLCSAQGITSGGCVPTMTSIAGLGTIPLAKTLNGRMLTSAKPIESPANAALVTLFDTQGYFIATIKHERDDET